MLLRSPSRRTTAGCLALIALLFAVPSQAEEWTGHQESVEGVLHVYNPETPRDGVRRIELKELWRRGGLDDEVLFGVISRVCVGESGEIYALDSQLREVQVYSADGEYLRSIGGPGEGPGEFSNSGDMFYGIGGRIGVLQAFPGKIIQLQPDGTPLDNFRLPRSEAGGFQLVFYSQANADRLVLAGSEPSRKGGLGVQTSYLRSFDSDGQFLAEFHTEEVYTKYGGMKYEEETYTNFRRRWTAFEDGRVAAALSFGDYTIRVWSEDGTLQRVVHRPEYPDLKRSREEKKAYQQFFNGVISWNPRSSFAVSDRHIAVSSLVARPDGRLWVLTGRGMFATDEGVALSYDVYDQSGRFIERIELVGEIDALQDRVYILGDRIYVVTDSLNSFLNMTSSGDEEEVDLDADPSMLVCYEMN